MNFEPIQRILSDATVSLEPPTLARTRSNSADAAVLRASPIGGSPLRDALRGSLAAAAGAEDEDGLEQPGILRQRSNSIGAIPVQNATSLGGGRPRTTGGGNTTPRAARLETLEWEQAQGGQGPDRGEHECIRVAARFRPLSEIEKKEGADKICVQFGDDGKTCAVSVDRSFGLTAVEFAYDFMFEPEATQEDVYVQVASPIIEGVINGFNGAIIAYGQTGSGKTHTMLGPAGASAFQTEGADVDMQELGIIPRALQELLDYAAPTEGQVQLRASYVEIYNEHIIDLLSPTKGGALAKDKSQQRMRENAENLYLPEVTETPVGSVSQALQIMRMGNMNRHMAETQMNRHSSRSHAVFVVTVTNSIDRARQKFAQLYLVDLAGSERVMKTGVTGARMEEAKQINRSLLALGQVIWALAHKQKHVPYRDSKLTQLLRNCLGGNARTAVMIAASPHQWNANESVSALRFGARASLVQNAARVNVAEDPKELKRLLLRAREDLNELRGHCRRLQAEVAAFSAADSLPLVSFGGAGAAGRPGPPLCVRHTSNTSSGSGSPAGEHRHAALTSKRLLVWGLLPSLVCPLNRAIMRDPVCAADGWTYERMAIEKHFARAGRAMPASPVTGQRMCSRHLVPCHVIKQLISQHLPDLAPPEVRLPAIAMLQAWLVMDILSYLDGKSLARSETAWTSFHVAADASQAWAKVLSHDFPDRQSSSALVAAEDDVAASAEVPSARAIYSQLKINEGPKRQQLGAEPASKGLKLFKPNTTR